MTSLFDDKNIKDCILFWKIILRSDINKTKSCAIKEL